MTVCSEDLGRGMDWDACGVYIYTVPIKGFLSYFCQGIKHFERDKDFFYLEFVMVCVPRTRLTDSLVGTLLIMYIETVQYWLYLLYFTFFSFTRPLSDCCTTREEREREDSQKILSGVTVYWSSCWCTDLNGRMSELLYGSNSRWNKEIKFWFLSVDFFQKLSRCFHFIGLLFLSTFKENHK